MPMPSQDACNTSSHLHLTGIHAGTTSMCGHFACHQNVGKHEHLALRELEHAYPHYGNMSENTLIEEASVSFHS